MRETFGYHVKSISDREHRELQPKEVYDIFMRDFVNLTGEIAFLGARYDESVAGQVQGSVVLEYRDERPCIDATGNGRLDCVSTAVKSLLAEDFLLESYTQHAIEGKSSAKAASYVSISLRGNVFWGCGIDSDVGVSSIKALISAVNKLISAGKNS